MKTVTQGQTFFLLFLLTFFYFTNFYNRYSNSKVLWNCSNHYNCLRWRCYNVISRLKSKLMLGLQCIHKYAYRLRLKSYNKYLLFAFIRHTCITNQYAFCISSKWDPWIDCTFAINCSNLTLTRPKTVCGVLVTNRTGTLYCWT